MIEIVSVPEKNNNRITDLPYPTYLTVYVCDPICFKWLENETQVCQ